MRPGPTPFVSKMKRVKWLPLFSELNGKLSENSQAAEDLILEKGTHSAHLHLAVSVSRHLCLHFKLNAGHVLRGMLLNPGFLKTLFDL